MELAHIISLAKDYDHQLPPAPAPFTPPAGREIAGWIDHTLLKPDATATQIRTLCQEAQQHHFASVCINPSYVPLASGLLRNAAEKVCVVVGFPLGATLPEYKVYETLACISAGAEEIDMVINIGALKSEAYGLMLNEIQAVTGTAHNQGALVKVIIETCFLTRQEKIMACLLSQAAGADFIKTSTGFGTAGATVEDVELMRCVIGPEMGLKAAGGIRTYADALAMIRAGATRLGASAGVKILQEAEAAVHE
ncbi:MAG: deoxyribose-phosphate aldolase [Anaerolineales bacterium]|nr:deoxyribose-phosphate aldolase [Anaerolineae bacterium]PWB49485.1 MAG: deoxyribose-phosphate aldolase [Anaerolineales bacterium]